MRAHTCGAQLSGLRPGVSGLSSPRKFILQTHAPQQWDADLCLLFSSQESVKCFPQIVPNTSATAILAHASKAH